MVVGLLAHHNEAKSHITSLANSKNVETIMIAYGDTIPQSAMDKFNEMAAAGEDGMNIHRICCVKRSRLKKLSFSQ